MFITSAYVSFTVQWRERSGACGEPVADLTGKSQGQRGSKLLITQEKTETEGLKKIVKKRKTYFHETVTTIQLHSTQALRRG